MWMTPFVAAALAQGVEPMPDPSPEEVVVYGDPFARWDGTRWLVTSELLLPVPMELGADRNLAFRSQAMQLRMVLACEQDAKLGKRRMEVLCEVEDIGLLATSLRHGRGAGQARAEAVLQEVDAALSGAQLQLQVSSRGDVDNLDIEGLVARDSRQGAVNESLRQMLLRVMAGFDLRIPDHAQREGQWYEYHSRLMEMPSLSAPRGSSTMVHSVTRHVADDYRYQLVQTLGQGTVQVALPNMGANEMRKRDVRGAGVQHRPVESAPPPSLSEHEEELPLDVATARAGEYALEDQVTTAGPLEFGTGPEGNPNFVGKESEVDMIYRLDNTGMAVFERTSGVMTERVWATFGHPTASSAGGTLNSAFHTIGQLRLLRDDEAPDVGPTAQVSWPRAEPTPGLMPWVDLDVAIP